jgi:LysM repeat protein
MARRNYAAEQPTVYYRPPAGAPAYAGPEAEQYYPAPQRTGRRWWLWLLLAGFVGLIAVICLASAGLVWWVNSDYIFPGLTVARTPIGGLTQAQAAAELDRRWPAQTITLAVDDPAGDPAERWLASAAELGLVLDTAATVQQAHFQGRSLNSILDILAHGGQVEVLPVWRYEPDRAGTYLHSMAAAVDRPAVNAGVQIVNGRAEPTPPQLGRRLDVAATQLLLAQNPVSVLQNGRLALQTAPVQPEIVDTAAVAAAANQLLAMTLTIRAFDPITGEVVDGQVTPDVWSQWLALEIVDPAAGQFRWQVDEGQLQNYLAGQAAAFGSERYLDLPEAAAAVSQAINNQSSLANIRVYHHERQHVVQFGETLASIGRDYGIPYPWLQQANPELDGGLYAGQVIRIPSPDLLLPLPVVQNKRIIVSITEQRTWVYENGQLKWDWPASTGIDDSPTAPGIFQVQSHVPNAYAANWDLWMPSFMGVYRPVPTSEFMNGFHGFPTRGGSQLLWTSSLGRKVTYGCILLSSENATILYDWAEEGVVVEIRP